jgi:5-methyltetrahydropteroyltriglutamate--homocysteine methyltransferase
MKLLDIFTRYQYPNETEPGLYHIHSPRTPTKTEMADLLERAKTVIPKENIRVCPDCGLKRRK